MEIMPRIFICALLTVLCTRTLALELRPQQILLVPDFETTLEPPTTQPFGQRLSFSDTQKKALVVTWSTNAPLTGLPCVEFAGNTFNSSSSSGNSRKAVACGASICAFEGSAEQRPHYVHTVTLFSLDPGAQYLYSCGNNADGWSEPRYFITPPFGSSSGSNSSGSKTANMIFLGDLGVAHSLTLPSIQADVSTGKYSAVQHVGDLAYDLGHLRGGRAIQFLKAMEPMSSVVPYMVTPGNHEGYMNLSYTWWDPAIDSSSSTRSSTSISSDAQISKSTWSPTVYKNPPAPVHVTIGGAGNPEMRIGPGMPPQGACKAEWCVFQSGFAPKPDQGYDFSYARVEFNRTHMHWQQVSVTFGKVIDEWWIEKFV